MFTPAAHRGVPRRYLLDLTWAGFTYHLAEDFYTFTDASGDSTEYLAGLDIGSDVPRDADVRSGEAPAVRVPALLHLVGLVDVPAQTAKGYDIGSATCRLWVWLEGTTSRVLLIDGVVDDPQIGPADMPVNCSLLDTREENLQRFPAALARVTPTTWPNMYGASQEQYYPWVFGLAGDEQFGAWGAPALVVDTRYVITASLDWLDFDEGGGELNASLTPGTYTAQTLGAHIGTQMAAVGAQAYTVSIEPGSGRWTIATNVGSTVDLLWNTGTNTASTVGPLIGADVTADSGAAQSHKLASRASGSPRRVLVAGHPVEETSVWMINGNDNTEEELTVTSEDDGLGRTVSTVDLTTGTVITADVAGRYFSRMPSQGGLKYRGALLTGAGDLLRWASEQTDVSIDRGSLESIADSLNVYKFGGYIMAEPASRVDLWSWLRAHVLPFLPVSVVDGPNGVGFVLWRWGAGPQDSILDITEGENAERAGLIALSDRSAIRNEFRLAYAQDARSQQYTRRYVVTGDRDDTEGTLSRSCSLSLDRYGSRDWEESANYIYDPATAARVCSDLAAELSPRHLVADYRLEESAGGFLALGDVVSVTDAEMHLAARRFFVVGAPVSRGLWVDVRLRSLE